MPDAHSAVRRVDDPVVGAPFLRLRFLACGASFVRAFRCRVHTRGPLSFAISTDAFMLTSTGAAPQDRPSTPLPVFSTLTLLFYRVRFNSAGVHVVADTVTEMQTWRRLSDLAGIRDLAD